MKPMHAERREPTCVWKWIDTGKCSNPGRQVIGLGLPMANGFSDDGTVSIDAPTCLACSERVRKLASLGVYESSIRDLAGDDHPAFSYDARGLHHTHLVEERPLQHNPEEVEVVAIPTCRRCGRRAPWCVCVGGSDYR